jgi:putative ABC transport system substrate-binding protein
MKRWAWRVILAVTSFVLIAPAWGQQQGNAPVVGLLVTHATVDDPIFEQLRAGLRERGYVDGRNIRLEIVTAEGKLDRLPGLAQELVRKNVAVIIAPNEASTRAAAKATTTIPIVMIGGQGYDPVALGLIESFSRPGGNITGAYGLWSELELKCLEILKEALPNTATVVVLLEPEFGRAALADLERGAQGLGLRLERIEVRKPEDLPAAFDTAKRKQVSAIIHLSSPLFYVSRARLGALSLQAKLPVVSSLNPTAEAGALISYGADVYGAWRRTAYYVDRLLRGASASTLPVEQTTSLKLVVNLKTAKALGIAIPESIMIRADEVIR